MSRRSKEDYIAVLSELKKKLGEELSIEECVLDFEMAAWVSLREVFGEISIHGWDRPPTDLQATRGNLR